MYGLLKRIRPFHLLLFEEYCMHVENTRQVVSCELALEV